MTTTDGNGYYGATTNSPSLNPKGIVGRTDGAALKAEIGARIAATATPFTAQTDSIAKTAANIVLDTNGIYDIYAIGILSRSAGSSPMYEIGIVISTTNNEDPLTIANIKAGRGCTLQSPSAVFSASATKFQTVRHMLGSVLVQTSTTYHAVVVAVGATFDGDAILYAIRRA
jgi:hypothetical protein